MMTRSKQINKKRMKKVLKSKGTMIHEFPDLIYDSEQSELAKQYGNIEILLNNHNDLKKVREQLPLSSRENPQSPSQQVSAQDYEIIISSYEEEAFKREQESNDLEVIEIQIQNEQSSQQPQKLVDDKRGLVKNVLLKQYFYIKGDIVDEIINGTFLSKIKKWQFLVSWKVSGQQQKKSTWVLQNALYEKFPDQLFDYLQRVDQTELFAKIQESAKNER